MLHQDSAKPADRVGGARHDSGTFLRRALRIAQLGTVTYEQVSCCSALAQDVEYYWLMSAAMPLLDTVVSRGTSRGATDLIVPLEGHFCAGAERYLFGTSEPRGYLVQRGTRMALAMDLPSHAPVPRPRYRPATSSLPITKP